MTANAPSSNPRRPRAVSVGPVLLSLCLRPRPDHCTEDLAQIAGKFGLDPETLGAILRADATRPEA